MKYFSMGVVLLWVGTSLVSADLLRIIGSEVPVNGQITSIDRGGVLVSVVGGTESIPWDRISQIEGEQLGERVGWQRWGARGEQLNLIRRRMERGDFTGAERLLRELPAREHAQMDRSDLFVADATLRCLLNRGALAEAVVPLLDVTRGLRSGLSADWEPIVDSETGWCAWLPPLLPDNVARDRLAYDLRGYGTPSDPLMGSLVAQWLAIAEGEQLDDTGLLMCFVRAIYGDRGDRQQARQQLESMLATADAEKEIWIRFAIGWSLLSESGRGRQRAGVAELAWLPATQGEANPMLTGWALAALSAHMRQDDRPGVAQTLHRMLAARYPTHPAVSNAHSLTQLLMRTHQEEKTTP